MPPRRTPVLVAAGLAAVAVHLLHGLRAGWPVGAGPGGGPPAFVSSWTSPPWVLAALCYAVVLVRLSGRVTGVGSAMWWSVCASTVYWAVGVGAILVTYAAAAGPAAWGTELLEGSVYLAAVALVRDLAGLLAWLVAVPALWWARTPR